MNRPAAVSKALFEVKRKYSVAIVQTANTLESAAIVETRGRFGTFISRFDPTDAAMAAAAKEYVDVAKALGLTKSDAMRYLTNVPDD